MFEMFKRKRDSVNVSKVGEDGKLKQAVGYTMGKGHPQQVYIITCSAAEPCKDVPTGQLEEFAERDHTNHIDLVIKPTPEILKILCACKLNKACEACVSSQIQSTR